jgi:hypothetical protein
MYAMNIQNDVIGLVLCENCKSKQVTDFIAWSSRRHDTIQAWLYTISDKVKEWLNTNENSYLLLKGGIRRFCFDLATLRIFKFDHLYWDWKYNKGNAKHGVSPRLKIRPLWPWPLTMKINTVPDSLKDYACTKFDQNPLKDVDSRVFTRMLCSKYLTLWHWPLTLKMNRVPDSPKD